MRREIQGTRRQTVPVELSGGHVATVLVDGRAVGEARWDGRTLEPLDPTETLPRIGERSAVADVALYEVLEEMLPPPPRMPRLPRVVRARRAGAVERGARRAA